jgi:hypothetical protein
MEAKMRTARACSNCKMAHTACDSNRPCARCSALGKEDTCVDVERKKRGRPKHPGDNGGDYATGAHYQHTAGGQHVMSGGGGGSAEVKIEPSMSYGGGGFPYQSIVQEAAKRQRAGTTSPPPPNNCTADCDFRLNSRWAQRLRYIIYLFLNL